MRFHGLLLSPHNRSLSLCAILLALLTTGCSHYNVVAFEPGTYPKVGGAHQRVYLFAPSMDTALCWQVTHPRLDVQGLQGEFRPLPADSAILLNRLRGKRIKRELEGTVLVHAARGWSFAELPDGRREVVAGQIRLVERVGEDKAGGRARTAVLVGTGVGVTAFMVIAVVSVFAAMFTFGQ